MLLVSLWSEERIYPGQLICSSFLNGKKKEFTQNSWYAADIIMIIEDVPQLYEVHFQFDEYVLGMLIIPVSISCRFYNLIL